MELALLLGEGSHGHLEHLRVGPEVVLGALGHDDDEGPALGMVADLGGQTDLGLPHAFAAALAAAVEEEDDGPAVVVFFVGRFGGVLGLAVVLRQVDLELVGGTVQLEGAVEETGFLGGALGRGVLAAARSGVRGQSHQREDSR